MGANGVYGSVRPAFITSDDVDIFYFYQPTRSSSDPDFSVFKKMDSNLLLQQRFEDPSNPTDKILTGVYDLKLPLSVFGKKGFYTIYIKPREVRIKISDVGVLLSYPDIKGIVIDSSGVISGSPSASIFENDNLVGYRVEYFENGNRQDFFRIITSNNKCEPISQTSGSGSQKAIRYRYNDSSNLIFCTLTPSTATNFKANAVPYIGRTEQEIVLSNTKFNPLLIEVEMTNVDLESINTSLNGNQIRNLENGLLTTFDGDNNNELVRQMEYFVVKSSTGNPIMEVKQERSEIDFTQDLNDVNKNI